VGALTTVACGQCHDTALPVGVTSWKVNCVMCHGGTANQTGAPPKAKWGNTDPIAVGAHTSHVAATHALSQPVDCVSCHVKPADALAAGHVDGAVTVTGYTGTNPPLLAAVGDPGWNRTAGTCATSYCHGATLQGGNLSTPTWTTVDGTQAACGTCHGIPPPTGRLSQIHYQGPFMRLHDLHIGVGYTCRNCHPGYGIDMTPNAAIHVNGAVEVGNFVKTWNQAAGSCIASCHGTTTVMQWR
jgi:predicted CxxxxCH...CXXCH cytochrome family protein